ncbi:PREDICTED: NF-kappa-B essential modulator isoform X1 [Rhagoletis zephyria]|uniref:NF-kappa-B essential modulator isoform X1 n=1 Tax=Rhagoletis zephyria TaxID=28612 RepID=UPI0008116B54|nr:PREDICTED: NF-kappa-B essential modulator isoform X1 [Rhagoletis zephyria]XP_017479065.1 PREDICTED: NF-kappa-B essential modulator isoform X1 [Rhagoletis zephyria]XP_017479066.1 PREDICTED: NF-kappa-B essential modulator isoform X1 [Rhagoletis zephyria]
MAEEESFVILGSCSQPNSLNSMSESKNTDTEQQSVKSVIQAEVMQPILNDAKFSSIKTALASATKTLDTSTHSELSKSSEIWKKSGETTAKALETSICSERSYKIWEKNGESLVDKSGLSTSKGDLQQDDIDMQEKKNSGTIAKSSLKVSMENETNTKEEVTNSLAVSYIMGQVPVDALKASLHSQFPSVSLEDCEELTTVMSDYLKMKELIIQVNNKMGSWLDMKKQMQANELENRQKLEQCQEQIAALRNENLELKRELESKLEQVQAYEAVRKLEHDDVVKNISEKTALIANMRTQIEKLEMQQLSSFEVISKFGKNEKQPEKSEYVTRLEHERIVKDFERNMSSLLAEKLEVSDMQKQYIDEINCLKVNLTASEELVNQLQSDIALLKASDKEKTEQFEVHARQRDEMREELGILRQQVDVYSRDFQLERTAREEMAGEKAQLLDDLRALQRKNQSLTEQLSHLEERITAITAERSSPAPLVPVSRKYYLQKTNPPATAAAPMAPQHTCPVCSIACNSLNSLQEHVNQCLDQNVHT